MNNQMTESKNEQTFYRLAFRCTDGLQSILENQSFVRENILPNLIKITSHDFSNLEKKLPSFRAHVFEWIDEYPSILIDLAKKFSPFGTGLKIGEKLPHEIDKNLEFIYHDFRQPLGNAQGLQSQKNHKQMMAFTSESASFFNKYFRNLSSEEHGKRYFGLYHKVLTALDISPKGLRTDQTQDWDKVFLELNFKTLNCSELSNQVQ